MKRSAALVAVGAALTAGAAGAQSRSFGDWHVACDNTLACSAFGFAPEEGGVLGVWIKVFRSGAPAAAPVVSAQSGEDAPANTVLPQTLRLNGPRPVSATATPVDGSVMFPPADSARIAAGLANATGLSIGPRPGQTYTISTRGSAAALLYMDERQRRVGTTTALMRRGAGRTPAPPVAPRVRRAPAVAQTGLPAALSAPLRIRQEVRDCADEGGPDAFKPEIARLSSTLVLYAVPCGAGAYNFSSLLLVADAQGRGARAAPVRQPPGYEANPDTPPNLLVNATYDPTTRTLSALSKGRGITDCGAAETWVWDGAAFQPAESLVMGECRGVGPDHWPRVWTATVTP